MKSRTVLTGVKPSDEISVVNEEREKYIGYRPILTSTKTYRKYQGQGQRLNRGDLIKS